MDMLFFDVMLSGIACKEKSQGTVPGHVAGSSEADPEAAKIVSIRQCRNHRISESL